MKLKSQRNRTGIQMTVAIVTSLAMGACSEANYQADADGDMFVPVAIDDPFAESWNLDCGGDDCPENHAPRNALNGQAG